MNTSPFTEGVSTVPVEQRIHFGCYKCGNKWRDLASLIRDWESHEEMAEALRFAESVYRRG